MRSHSDAGVPTVNRSFVSGLLILLCTLAAPALAGGYSTQSKNYMVDAIQRTTLHSYPTGGSAQALPLVIVLHGDGGTAAGIRASLPLEAQANGAAAFSYLSSAGASFEYWTDAGRGHEGRFVQAIIANYGVAGVTIDPARVYLVGFSGGGTMAQALGCRLGAGVIRKMGIHSGSLYPVDNDFTYTGNGGVSCSLPGTMLIWGKLDQTNGVDYATGQAIRNNHLATQNCAATTTNTSPVPCIAYDQCTRPVEWCAIDGLGHALWNSAAQAFWRYFAADGVAAPEAPLFVDGFEGGVAPPASPRWVMGYHVGYERGLLPTANIDFASITHLMVGRLIPNANATVTDHFDIDAVNGPIWAQAAVNAAHAANRKAILMVGGAGEINGWRGAAASPASRATFVTNLLAKLDQYGADGLDLDWEPVEPQDQAPLLALAQALRTQRPNLLLTMPVGWINSNFPPNNEAAFMDAMGDVLDRMAVMSYGMLYEDFGWWSWHSSALAGHKGNTPSSVTSGINYYLGLGVPAAKLAVGTGFYGTCYQRVTAPDQATQGGDIVGSDGSFSYRNIVANYLPAMTAHYDAAANAPWLSSVGGVGPVGARCNYLTYENAASIAAKGNFVRTQGLGGTIIWTIAQGYRPELPVTDANQLLRAVKAAFLD